MSKKNTRKIFKKNYFCIGRHIKTTFGIIETVIKMLEKVKFEWLSYYIIFLNNIKNKKCNKLWKWIYNYAKVLIKQNMQKP